MNDDPALTGKPVEQAIDAIDWSTMPALVTLGIRVGGLYEVRPIDADLGFLRSLPALRHLDLASGILHRGPGPSPLEPPFDGLSRQLTSLRIEADEPEPLRAALREYLGVATDDPEGPSVRQRYPYEEPAPPWSIREDDDGCSVYGSFAREEHAAHDDVTEYDALRRARARLRAVDPALDRRLDFDPESAGTGIMAARREDLERALAILR